MKKDNSIWAAIIGAVAALGAGYLSYRAVTSGTSEAKADYTGTVRGSEMRPVSNASVSITEDQLPPQLTRTDSEGTFHVLVRKKTEHLALRVEADGYTPYERIDRKS